MEYRSSLQRKSTIREEKDIEIANVIVMDLSRITKISLKDSDRAGADVFKRNLVSLVREKGSTPEIVFGGIRLIYVLPEDLGCREIYLERVQRGIMAKSIGIKYDLMESAADESREIGLESLPDLLNGV